MRDIEYECVNVAVANGHRFKGSRHVTVARGIDLISSCRQPGALQGGFRLVERVTRPRNDRTIDGRCPR